MVEGTKQIANKIFNSNIESRAMIEKETCATKGTNLNNL